MKVMDTFNISLERNFNEIQGQFHFLVGVQVAPPSGLTAAPLMPRWSKVTGAPYFISSLLR